MLYALGQMAYEKSKDDVNEYALRLAGSWLPHVEVEVGGITSILLGGKFVLHLRACIYASIPLQYQRTGACLASVLSVIVDCILCCCCVSLLQFPGTAATCLDVSSVRACCRLQCKQGACKLRLSGLLFDMIVGLHAVKLLLPTVVCIMSCMSMCTAKPL